MKISRRFPGIIYEANFQQICGDTECGGQHIPRFSHPHFICRLGSIRSIGEIMNAKQIYKILIITRRTGLIGHFEESGTEWRVFFF